MTKARLLEAAIAAREGRAGGRLSPDGGSPGSGCSEGFGTPRASPVSAMETNHDEHDEEHWSQDRALRDTTADWRPV